MEDVVFVSVAFGERYVEQQRRLKESILAIYPSANIMFWADEYPPGSRTMDESLYGFKVHAIMEAKKTFSRVVWVDTAMVLHDKIDDLFKYSIVAVRDDNKLYNLISDRAANYYEMNKGTIQYKEWHLVGGSLYYFDFTTHDASIIFGHWFRSERDGIFGSQRESASEQINGHRHDETCMAMCMYIYGIEPIPGDQVRYCIEKNPMVTKQHFK